MNSFRNLSYLLITFYMALVGPPFLAAVPDALWEKAVAWAAHDEEMQVTPGRMDVSILAMKKDGSVVSRSEVAYRVVGFGKDADAEIISVKKDGKDITAEAKREEAKEKAEAEKEKKKKGSSGAGGKGEGEGEEDESFSLEPAYHPFSPESRSKVTYRRVGESPLAGKAAILFSFKEEGSKGREGKEGKAWLEPASGRPIQVESRPTKLPKHTDRMVQRVHFADGPDGLWVVERSEIDGEGGLLWIHRKVESSIRFSEFRKRAGS